MVARPLASDTTQTHRPSGPICSHETEKATQRQLAGMQTVEMGTQVKSTRAHSVPWVSVGVVLYTTVVQCTCLAEYDFEKVTSV